MSDTETKQIPTGDVLARMQRLHDDLVFGQPQKYRSAIDQIRHMKRSAGEVPDHAFLKNFYCEVMHIVGGVP